MVKTSKQKQLAFRALAGLFSYFGVCRHMRTWNKISYYTATQNVGVKRAESCNHFAVGHHKIAEQSIAAAAASVYFANCQPGPKKAKNIRQKLQ